MTARRLTLTLLATALACAAPLAALAGLAPGPDRGRTLFPPGMTRARLDVVVGGEIYREHCVTCHGEKGDARTALGQSLVPRVRDLTGPQAAARLTDRQMAQVIAQGLPGTSMAPW